MISTELAGKVYDKACEHGIAKAARFTEVPVTKTGLQKLANDCRAVSERLTLKGVSDEARQKGLKCVVYAQVFGQLAEGNEAYARVTLEI